MPAFAATEYLDGSPELSALISGVNEFAPGEDAAVTIIIRNSGLNTFKHANSGTIARDDLPNTAKLVTVQLSPGSAPITIKSDPQPIGDIAGAATARVTVKVKIADNAPAGEYKVPLNIQYRYLEHAFQDGSDQMQFVYTPVNQTFPLSIRIKPLLKIAVLSVSAESLNIGTEGYIHLQIRNSGSEDGKKATVKLTRSGTSPIIPTDSSVFIGDFPSGSVVNCTYKASVSTSAEPQTYPVDVSVTYQDYEGSTVTSSTETVGIPVGGKATFGVVSASPEIAAGKTAMIAVEYKNTAGMTVYSSQARITAVPPFISSDDTAYLGDIRPGDTATARYEVSVDSNAEPREYTLDSEIRYRDALGNSQIADTIKVTVRIMPRPAENPLFNPVVLTVLAAIAIGAGYYLVVMRKKL